MNRDVTSLQPLLLADDAPEARRLAADPGVVVVDELAAQLDQLARCRAPRNGHVRAVEDVESAWAYYPWRRTLVRVLPERLHRELRFDRNRYAITAAEQERLTGLRVAVAGLSVGRAIVSAMAHEGIGGELRLADFDVLDLSNLNRIAGGIADVGINKVVLAAREVAELDPYVRVVAYPDGVDETTIEAFVADADVIVDECDDLEMKVRLREHARAAGIPVVMATSHRGMLDVERFDLEPARPVFHGLLGDVTSGELRGLTTKQKVPYVIRILDPAGLSDRAAASLVEVKETVSTWPQLASDVALGGAMVANAVRRIALGELTASGRFHADLDELTADGRQLAPRPPADRVAARRPEPMPVDADDVRFVVACACTAPSGGNMQPWRFEADGNVVRAWADGTRSSLLDFRGRASVLALGAALEAAVIGARARGLDAVAAVPAAGPVWELALNPSGRTRDDRAAAILWERSCNRRTDASPRIPRDALVRLARHAGASVVPHDALVPLGAALGALDRVRFLSERLRRDMLGELRFDGGSRDGIDVASLELDATDRAAMDVLRTGAGMDLLADLDRGWGLANASRDAFAGSGGALVLQAPSTGRAALVEAGRGLMRLWLEATRQGIAVHPWGSPFLFQPLFEAGELTDWERSALTDAAAAFGAVVPLDRKRPVLLVLRLSLSAPPSTRSLRRPLDDVLSQRMRALSAS